MTEEITLCWQADRPTETLSSVDAVLDRLVKITADTTPDNGIATVLTKSTGQEMVVIAAGNRWCLDWFPEDYQDQGCVGSYHTVASPSGVDTEDIITYFIQGHHSECLAAHTVQKGEAIQAIRSFVSSPERPDCVEWEMD